MSRFDFIVIGGGAAGYFAAIQAALAKPNFNIAILEATTKPLAKVRISGGGRCNVTHSCFETLDLVRNYPRGNKELRQAFSRFQPKDTIEFFKNRGIELKTEKDGRMFPTTNSSQTIIDCFENACTELGITIFLGDRVTAINPVFASSESQVIENKKKITQKQTKEFHLKTKNHKSYQTKYVLLSTGSSPAGVKLAESLGHELSTPVPSLFTFKISSPLLSDLAGVSFPAAEALLAFSHSKKKYTQLGPILITHWGLSGPAVLKLSAFGARELHEHTYDATLTVNWVNLSFEDCFRKLKDYRDGQRKKSGKKAVGLPNLFSELGIVKRFWVRLLEISKLDQIFSSEAPNPKLETLAKLLVKCELKVEGKGIFKEEFVTCGGIKRKEINFKRMESKRVSGLFFSGEVIDIDGVTGGFNFQNAWTGSYISANSLD